MNATKPLSSMATVIVVAAAASTLLPSCTRENDGPRINPNIQFMADSGYTFMDDTVGTLDTLRFGVLVTRGSDPLRYFTVGRSLDGGPYLTTDSIAYNEAELRFDTTVVARGAPGLEAWRFRVVERDGDIVYRTLTLTVQ